MDLKIALVAVVVCFIISAGISLAVFGWKDLQLAGIATLLIMLFLLLIVAGIARAVGGALEG